MQPDNSLHELITEVRLIRSELQHVGEQNKQHNDAMAEIFDRLRRIESTIAVLHATKPQRANAWAITAVLVSTIVALITFIEAVGVPAQ